MRCCWQGNQPGLRPLCAPPPHPPATLPTHAVCQDGGHRARARAHARAGRGGARGAALQGDGRGEGHPHRALRCAPGPGPGQLGRGTAGRAASEAAGRGTPAAARSGLVEVRHAAHALPCPALPTLPGAGHGFLDLPAYDVYMRWVGSGAGWRSCCCWAAAARGGWQLRACPTRNPPASRPCPLPQPPMLRSGDLKDVPLSTASLEESLKHLPMRQAA